MTEARGSRRDAISVICKIVLDHPEIDRVRLVVTPRAPRAQTRLSDHPEVTPLLERGAELRAIEGMPFWDTVLLAAERSEHGLPEPLASAASYHQTVLVYPHLDHPAQGDLERWMRTVADGAKQDEIISFSSKVILRDGSEAHVPMLDFSARTENSGSLSSARTIVKELGVPGFLLDSGRSFHFYGSRLVSDTQLPGFLGAALLFAPLVDGRWVAHQLIGSACALRISLGRDGRPPYESLG